MPSVIVGVSVAVRFVSVSVPAPVIEPAVYANGPFVTVTVCVAPIVIVPDVVNPAPDPLNVRLIEPSDASNVPVFVNASPNVSVRLPLGAIVTVPLLACVEPVPFIVNGHATVS